MNRILATCATILAVMATSSFTSLAEATNVGNGSEAAYTQEINRRAEKIVTTLGIADSAKGARVRAIIARQYRDLSEIHDARDVKIKSAKGRLGLTTKAAADAEIKAAKDTADTRLQQLHSE